MFVHEAPELLQSSHRYAYEVGLPFQDPFEVESVCPWTVDPDTAGAAVFDGAEVVTVAVAPELADADPPALVVVTTARIVSPTSLACSVYVLEVAAEMFVHAPPVLLQSSHRYAYEVGLPLHDPFEVESVCPWTVDPDTAGAAVFDGAEVVTVAVAPELADADPPALVVVTTARIVSPTSLACSVYVLEVAAEMFVHAPPVLLQSSHRYAYEVGLPFQDPFEVESVCPWTVDPDTTGAAVFAGAFGVTTEVAPEDAEPDPPGLVAVTTDRSVCPTFALVSV